MSCIMVLAQSACRPVEQAQRDVLGTPVQLAEKTFGFKPSSVSPAPGSLVVSGPSGLAEWSEARGQIVREVTIPAVDFDGDMYEVTRLSKGIVVLSSAWYAQGYWSARVHVFDREWSRRTVVLGQHIHGATYSVLGRTLYALYDELLGDESAITLASIDLDAGTIVHARKLGHSDGQVVDPTMGDVVVFNERIYVGWTTSTGFRVDRYLPDLTAPPDATWIGRPTLGFRARLAAGATRLYVATFEDRSSVSGAEIVTLSPELRETGRTRSGERYGFKMAFSSHACELLTAGAEVFDGQSVRALPGSTEWVANAPFDDVRSDEGNAYFVRLAKESAVVVRTRLPKHQNSCGL